MALLINLHHLEKNNLSLQGEIPAAELDLEEIDECARLSLPLKYNLDAQLFDKHILVQGRLHTTLDCNCVRCLKSFPQPLDLPDWICHLSREGEDAVKVVNDCVDLTPQIREDILLSFPQHPLCEPGCHGLNRSASTSMDSKHGASSKGTVSSTWAELNKLKL